MNTGQLKPLTQFNAEVVQIPLKGLLTNINRELERSLKQAMESRSAAAERHWSLLLIMLRVALNSYEAICFLLVSADKDPEKLRHFALVLPPVNRQMMDALFSLVYMRDDFPTRSLEYEVSGYRQFREMRENFSSKYSAIPEWQPHLQDLHDLQQTMETYLPITPEQKANPSTITFWPPPSRLRKRPTASRAFLNYLHTWLYNDTSAQSHLNAVGLAEVGGFLISSLAPEDMRRLFEERTIRQYTYVHFTRTLIVVLAIATEIDAHFNFRNREAVTRTWGLLSGFVEEAKEVYEERYKAMLS